MPRPSKASPKATAKAQWEAYDLLAVINSLGSGLLLMNPTTGEVTAINRQLLDWTALKTEDFVGKAITSVLQLQRKDDCPLCSGKGEGFVELHTAYLNQSGDDSKGIKVKLRHSALPDGTVICMMELFSEDLSLSSAHSDFVSTVSHEFRTPLTSIKGFAETMLRYGEKLPPEHMRRFVIIIKEQADRLTRMVENLLSVSKLGAGKLELAYRPVAMKPLIEKVVETVKAKEASSPRNYVIQVNEAETEAAWSDPDKLEQVVINLVDNAVKYSFENTTVTVQVNPVEGRDDFLELRVSDQGVGIPKDHQHKIFTKFSRIDNPLTRNAEGSGLGLYITKSLTLALGGTIDVESEPEQGTTFILKFPMATAQRQEAYKRRLLVDSGSADDDDVAPAGQTS